MKFYENYKKNTFIKKGILFALGISIILPILSYLNTYIPSFAIYEYLYSINHIVANIFGYVYHIIYGPHWVELLFTSVFIPWILIRFLVFSIFGYYNGLLYEKISSRFKYLKIYFIVTSLIFYYVLLNAIQLIGIIFFGGLP